jgi:hypothetical protein
VEEVIEQLKKLNHDKPLLMQFDLLDPDTNEVLTTITNVAVREVAKTQEKKLHLRNTTIKAYHLHPDNIRVHDRQREEPMDEKEQDKLDRLKLKPF